MPHILGAVAGACARRAKLTVAVAVALGALGGGLALTLTPNAAIDTFVGRSSTDYRETQRYYRSFGEEPVQVMVRGSLQQLLLSEDIGRLLGLEGCLAGRLPPSALAVEGGLHGPCAQLESAGAVKVVLGPGTFINEAAIEIDNQLAGRRKQAETQAKQARRAVSQAALRRGLGQAQAHALGEQARKATLTGYAAEVSALALHYGLSSLPALNNPSFVSALVFSNAARAGTPKQRFAYLFPSRNAALISVRLRAGLSHGAREHAIALIRSAVAMRQWHLRHGESYVVTGEPVLASDLAGSITRSLVLLLIAAALVMAATLGLIFAGRPRLLPLGIALIATAITFGGLALFSGAITLAEVAVLPVLIGLAVDYAIQLQARVGEAMQSGGDVEDAVRVAAQVGAPSIFAAALAGACALLALLLSPAPTVRGFGVLLVAGIVVALGCALTAGSAAIALAVSRRSPAHVSARPAGQATPARVAAAWRGAQALLRENPLTRRLPAAALDSATARPAAVVGTSVVLAALGWAAFTRTEVQSDIAKLAPQQLSSLQGLRTLEREAGVGGQLEVMVSGRDLARPAVIEWMSSYQIAMLARLGYTESRGCGAARLCPAFSLPELLREAHGTTGKGGSGKLGAPQLRSLLAAIPPYFSQEAITPDDKVAALAFGIKLMPLSEQQRVIEAMRAHLNPPSGVRARVVGLAVLAARADAQVSSTWRRAVMLLIGLALAALALMVAFKGRLARALVPMVPVVLATGWAALVTFLVGVPLNPLSVTLGAMVIAISAEFSVLLAERYRQERLNGHAPAPALRRTFHSTGAAVSASAVTATAGFAVLILSDVRMLRDFGAVTVIDLTVSLVGVLLVLPSTLMLLERERAPRHAGGRREVLVRRAQRLRRRDSAAGETATGHETA